MYSDRYLLYNNYHFKPSPVQVACAPSPTYASSITRAADMAHNNWPCCADCSGNYQLCWCFVGVVAALCERCGVACRLQSMQRLNFMVYCTLPVRVTTCLACLAAGGRPVSLLVASSPLVLEKPYKCFFTRTVVLQFLVLTALCKRSREYSIGTADSHMLHIMHCWNHTRTCHSNVVFVWLTVMCM